jgi:hypothetical protein
MGLQRIKPNYRSRVLRLPDLDHCKFAVLASLGWPSTASSSCAIACTWNRGIWAANTIKGTTIYVSRQNS